MQYFKKSAGFNFLKKPKKQKTPCFFDWEKKRSQNRYCSSSLFWFGLLKSEKYSSFKLLELFVEKTNNLGEKTHILSCSTGRAGSCVTPTQLVAVWQSLGLDRSSGVRLGSHKTNDCCSPGGKREFIPQGWAGSSPCLSVQGGRSMCGTKGCKTPIVCVL